MLCIVKSYKFNYATDFDEIKLIIFIIRYASSTLDVRIVKLSFINKHAKNLI